MKFLIVIVALVLCTGISDSCAQTPPTQPANGPGGSTLPWSNVLTTTRTVQLFSGKNYFIITPTGWVGGGAAPTTLPLVIFMHGYSLKNPSNYASWISHIARQGNVVIFPDYETFASNQQWTPNAIDGIKHAIEKDAFGNWIRPWPNGLAPNLSLGMLLFGHSAGALVAANIANRYQLNSLPAPTALVLGMAYRDTAMDASLSGIPATTRLLCAVANQDSNVGRTGCDDIFDRTNHLTTRSYVWIYSQSRGAITLKADHHISEESNPKNAFDWNALWKFTDAMQTCVIASTNCSYVYGNGIDQTGLGQWSDGVPVTPMTATFGKPVCPQSGTPLGC